MARLALCLMVGILLSVNFSAEITREYYLILQVLSTLFALVYFVAVLVQKERQLIPKSLFLSILALFTVILLGFLHTHAHNEQLDATHLSNRKDSVRCYEARIVSEVTIKPNHNAFLIEMLSAKSAKGWTNVHGRVKIYARDSSTQYLEYGDTVLIWACPQQVAAPKNPKQFDYLAFLSRQNIHHQQFVGAGEITKLSSPKGWGFMRIALKARHYSDSVLKTFLKPETEEYAVAAALLLGLRTELDDDTLQAYSVSGTMHILAVSGMHVALLFVVFDWLLSWWKVRKRGNWLYLVAALTILWSYATLTGLSASVLRAAAMLTVVVLAETFGKRKNIYNTLSASVFGLLLYCPYLLLDVGFQLSCLAVFGIVFIHRQLERLWSSPYFLLDLLWQTLCVSVAAQIMTMPISLYYFDQFPTYFLLANLLIVPWCSFMMYSGLLLLILHAVPYIGWLLAWITKWQIWLMNFIVFQIDTLPMASIEHIHLEMWEVVLFYLFLFTMFLFLVQKRFNYLIISFLLSIIWLTGSWWQYQEAKQQHVLAIMHLPNHSHLLFLNAQQARVYADSSLLLDIKAFKNNMLPFLNSRGCADVRLQNWEQESPDVMIKKTFYGERIYWEGLCIDHLQNKLTKPIRGQSELVLVSHDALGSLRMIEELEFKYLIFDATNKIYRVQKLQKEAMEGGLSLYDVQKNGAWIKAREEL